MYKLFFIIVACCGILPPSRPPRPLEHLFTFEISQAENSVQKLYI